MISQKTTGSIKTYQKWLFWILSGSLLVSWISLGLRAWKIQRDKRESGRLLVEKQTEMAQVVTLSEYLKSDAFLEGEIRNKLGFTKEGEVLFILPPDEVIMKLQAMDWTVGENKSENIPNWKKWLNLFVGKFPPEQ